MRKALAEWYAKRDHEIVRLRKAGWSAQKLAGRFAITRARIYQILEAQGIPSRPRVE